VLEKLENLGHTCKWGRLVAAALAIRLRLYLAEGRINESSACLNRLERLEGEYAAPTRCAWSDIRDYTLLARALLASAHNRLQDTIAILQGVRQEAEATNNHYWAVCVTAQLSAALLAADEGAEALRVFRDVLRLAAPTGFYQTILDEGPEIGTLLLRFQNHSRCARDSDDLLPDVGNLIVGWRERYQPNVTTPPTSLVVESLSPREQKILERIGQGRSNKEIARELGIAPETVKSHIKNIFIKLAVERRAQAVSRAQSLGLIRI
jgi:LuxR family transcriptional regulator, maltose regulon positive regulatory protein